MLRKNDGFILAELFLSLAIWVLIAGFFVPIMIHLIAQSSEIKEKLMIVHVFYEYLQEVETEKNGYRNVDITKENKTYEMEWVQKAEKEWEVCISYENIYKLYCERVKQ